MDAIFTFIAENYPLIGVVIISGVIGGIAVRYHISIQQTKKKVDALPCIEHGQKLDELQKKTEKFDALPCDEHGKKLDEVQIISKKVDALKVTSDKMVDILSEICGALVSKKMIDPNFKPVKNWLFNNPRFKETDIDMSDLCWVAGFELRDAYLKKHPEIMPDYEFAKEET